MRDPMTVAHEIKYPWYESRPWPRKLRERVKRGTLDARQAWDEMTPAQQQRCCKHFIDGTRRLFITIWHDDPQSDGSDDSCGFCVPKLSRFHRERLKSLAWCEAQSPYYLRQSGRTWAGSRADAEVMYRGLILQVCWFAQIPMTFEEAARRGSAGRLRE